MKKPIHSFSGIFLIIIFLIITYFSNANSSGAVGGNSSSGGDFGQSCGNGGCHGGGHTVSSVNFITSNIPLSGYIPGNTYTIMVSGDSNNRVKFGFEFAAENLSNATAGTLVSTDARTQVRPNGQITHTSSGNGGIPTGFGWQFNWTAPNSGSGTITFSTAVLFTNNNGSSSGDVTQISSLNIQEDLTVSLAENKEDLLEIFPNPTTDFLVVKASNEKLNLIEVYDLSGKKLVSTPLYNQNILLDLRSLSSGNYIIKVLGSDKEISKRIVKK